VRDLLAVDSTPAEVLPADDVAEGFDNIADRAAGVAVIHRAVRDRGARRGGQGDGPAGRAALAAGPSGPVRARSSRTCRGCRSAPRRHPGRGRPPVDGEYVVDIADMATHIWGNGMEFENPLVVLVDNKVVYETVIGGEEDMKAYDQVQKRRPGPVNARLKNIRFKPTAGPHKIGVTFRRRTFAESGRSAADVREGRRPGPLLSRAVVPGARAVQRQGLSATPSRDRIFVCKPAPARRRGAGACAQDDHRRARAPRLPAAGHAEDVDELFAVLPGRRQGGRLRVGVRSAVTGVLASPFFLYRGEHVPKGLRRAAPTRSAISSWRRTCRSSCGTRFPTTSCCSWPSTGS
jgi:hypothetical protein